jgi:nucleotide-binding universal stress UspA family protein
MKILLAVDGSKYSLDAARSLIEHADWYRDKPAVELVFVHLPVPRLPGVSRFITKAQLASYYREEGEAQLARAKKLLEGAGVACRARVLVGPVAETIVRHAREARCDLIFIGTRGMTAAGNMLLGSTATKVLHLSKVPVLVVK